MHRGSKPAGAMSGVRLIRYRPRACDCRKQQRRVKLIVEQYRLCLSDFDYQYPRGPKNNRLLCVGRSDEFQCRSFDNSKPHP
jgi:hypothetical protein